MRRRAVAVRADHDHLFDAGSRQLVEQPGNRPNAIAGAMRLPFPVALRRKSDEMGLRQHRHTQRSRQCLENLVAADAREIDQIPRVL